MGSFYTNVISQGEWFRSIKRVGDIALLEHATRHLVPAVVSTIHPMMRIELMIYETYRSQDRPQAFFNQGATKLSTVGVHHYGLACIVRVAEGEPSWKGDFFFPGTTRIKQRDDLG